MFVCYHARGFLKGSGISSHDPDAVLDGSRFCSFIATSFDVIESRAARGAFLALR
jgi:hypothetical protein